MSTDQGLRRPDIKMMFTDGLGKGWNLSVELKTINGRPEIVALLVRSIRSNVAINRRLLRELPLESLFGEAIALEAKHLNQRATGNKRSTAHQGRRHTDDELRAVVHLYMDAQRGRRPVQATVAKALGISVAAANRRIIAARRRGLFTESHAQYGSVSPRDAGAQVNQKRPLNHPSRQKKRKDLDIPTRKRPLHSAARKDKEFPQ